MLTENELLILSDDKKVQNAIAALRQNFHQLENDFQKIIYEDFIALILLAPAVGLALANKEITFFEELMLNRKARQLSRDFYFLKKDPIVFAMKYLVIHFEEWEDKFYGIIKLMIEAILEKNHQTKESLIAHRHLDNEELLSATPPILVRLIAFLFLDQEEDFFATRNISIYDYKEIFEISQKLGIDELPIFQRFYDTFNIM